MGLRRKVVTDQREFVLQVRERSGRGFLMELQYRKMKGEGLLKRTSKVIGSSNLDLFHYLVLSCTSRDVFMLSDEWMKAETIISENFHWSVFVSERIKKVIRQTTQHTKR